MDTQPGWSLFDLALVLGGVVDGPDDFRVLRPCPAEDSDPQGLAFAEGKFIAKAMESGVGAVIVPPDAPASAKPLIRHPHPRAAFAKFLAMNDRKLPVGEGISERAWVSPGARVDRSARIGAFAVVEDGAVVLADARIYPFAYVGPDCVVSEGAVVYPHAVLVQSVTVGARSIIQPGAVIGKEGFGFAWDGRRRVKIPQVGGVELGEEVEIGANSAVDRATAGTTKIGDGVKLDNLVQVAHNTKIGAHSVLASQTGIAGSSTIGERCVLGGQVGMADHKVIVDDVHVGGQAGVVKDLLAPGAYSGFPARPIVEELRLQALFRKLPEILDRLKELEARVKELQGR